MSIVGRDGRRRRREGRVAIIALMSVPTADQHTAHAARLDRFLHEEPVVWLSTVRPDGAPHIVPIWFTWDGTSLLVFSKPGAQKVRNVRVSPIAMLALGEPEDDFDVAMAEARVELLDEPATELPWAHLAKYGSRMAALGLSPDQFVATYSQVIRITPTRYGAVARPNEAAQPAPMGPRTATPAGEAPLRSRSGSWLRPGQRPALGDDPPQPLRFRKSARISRAAFLPGWPGDAAARMGARPRQVQPVERQPVARVAEHRPPQEELVEPGLGVERVATGQTEVALEVERRQDLPGRDQRRQPGRHPSSVATTASPTSSRRVVPRALAQGVRRVLGDHAHDVGPGRRAGHERRIGQ